MKTCPICNSVAFDDAAICFGCMYHYDKQESEVPSEGAEAAKHVMLPGGALHARHGSVPPAFLIKMIPVFESSGAIAWSCSVDVAE